MATGTKPSSLVEPTQEVLPFTDDTQSESRELGISSARSLRGTGDQLPLWVRLCECGCGGAARSRFIPGHMFRSARFRSPAFESARLRAHRDFYKARRADPEHYARCAARFWSRVDKNGPVVRLELGRCWLWTGSLFRGGYGQVKWFGRARTAHTVSWELVNGHVPAGEYVLHRCDRRDCVRPAHLFTGSPAVNSADAVAKGRTTRGERSGRARLTNALVQEIRARFAAGDSRAALARAFGVTWVCIAAVVARKSWAHIPPAEDAPDGVAKVGMARGERCATAKLTADAVREIRTRVAAGDSRVALAAAFDVTRDSIVAIVTRKSWAHIA